MKSSQSGFTIVEVLVALMIMSIVIAFSTASFVFSSRSNHNAEIRSEASQAGQTVLDEIRRLPVEQMRTSGTETRNVNVNSARRYSVQVNYCSNGTYCSSNEVRQMSVTVTRNNETVYKTETVYTNLGDPNGGESDNNSTSTIITTTTTTSTSTSISTTTTSTTSTSRSTSSTSTTRRTTTTTSVSRPGGCRFFGC